MNFLFLKEILTFSLMCYNLPSSTEPFGLSSPDSIALLTIPSEERSLILPPGFKNSHFAKILPGPVTQVVFIL